MVAATAIDILERTSRELPGRDLAVFLMTNDYLIIAWLRSLSGCVLVEDFDQKLATREDPHSAHIEKMKAIAEVQLLRFGTS
jgi:hypothetical protein